METKDKPGGESLKKLNESGEKLNSLKKLVENSYQYWRKNAERYKEFMRFIFDTSLTNEDIEKLKALKKPTLEFNVLESIVSRLRGEFAKQEPSIMVRAADGVPLVKMTDEFLATSKMLENHMRASILDSENEGLAYRVHTDQLGGGYSVMKVFNDYINELSFDQKIYVQRVFDPTLTGFDPMAREPHKGDGNYCFELFPRTKEEFEEEFGKGMAEEMRFCRDVGAFSWSYPQQQQDVVLVCEFFEKKKKKVKIIKISTGHVVTEKHYKELLEKWNEKGFIEQPPVVVSARMSELEHIVRYRFCENKILSYDETDYKYLPLVFVDGNSVDVSDTVSGASCQMTRPYAYHAKGIQQLKNYAGQCVGSEMENMVQHKFKVAFESIPDDYMEAYRNIQQADTLIYNAFLKGDTNIPLPPPMEIQRTPTPPIVENTFLGADKVTQSILGAYDSVLGVNDKDVSGVAISNGAIQSATASTPYLVSYIHALNRVAVILLDLIPKYYVTPRSLPIMTPDGKRSYQIINDDDDPSSIKMGYQPQELDVKVEAGVNTSMQKQVALDQIIRMMQASPLFAEFINTEGLETLMDNLDIRGIDELKVRAGKFMEAMKKQQAEQAQQPDPQQEMLKMAMEVEQAKVEQQRERAEGELAVSSAKVAIEQQKVDIMAAQAIEDIESNKAKIALEQEKVASSTAKDAVDAILGLVKHRQESSKEE
jgi:hypothetical protein